jgi:hypothetical protein
VQQISLTLAHLMVRLCLAARGFAAAAKHLSALGLPHVCTQTLRQVVLGEGEAAQKALHEQAIDPGWRLGGDPDATEDAEPSQGGVVGVDGLKISTNTDAEKAKRRRKTAAKRGGRARQGKPPLPPLPPRRQGTNERWKEAKLAGVYDFKHKHAFWRVTCGDHHQARVLAGQASRKVRFDQAQPRLAITDGATWIEHRLRECRLDLDAHILDFFHFAQHVHEAANAVHPEVGEALAWAHQVKDLARTQGPDSLLAKLREASADAAKDDNAVAAEALKKLLNYLEPRRHMIDYPKYLAKGWPIGSGPTESICKAATRFIKGPGKRWDLDNAQAMMTLEALDIGGQLETFFEHRRKKAA